MKNFFDDDSFESEEEGDSSFDDEMDDIFSDKDMELNDIFDSLIEDLTEPQLEALVAKLSEYLSG